VLDSQLAESLLFVIGNAATLITDACLKGELRSWLDRVSFPPEQRGPYRRLFDLFDR
jgi:hypothetical protein